MGFMDTQDMFLHANPIRMAEIGISCLKQAVVLALLEASHKGKPSLKESEICFQLGLDGVQDVDRIIFSVLNNLAAEGVAKNVGNAQWQLRETEV